EPSNWISPSRAFSNWERGISTFLMTPRMSVNCRRRNRTFSESQTFRISGLFSPGPAGSNFRILPFAILLSLLCRGGRILGQKAVFRPENLHSDVENPAAVHIFLCNTAPGRPGDRRPGGAKCF